MAIPGQRCTIMVVSKGRPFSTPTWLSEDEFKVVFIENYTKIYSILYRLTGNRFDADDLTAETFWRLWERPPVLKENLGGWLYRVATNLGYNLLRGNWRRKNHEERAGLETLRAQDDLDPQNEIESVVERERVHHVLSKLSRRETQVLVLRHSGLSYKEIAAAVHVAPGSVGTLLARAEERFLDLYRQGEKDAP
jgi:RNA polymerase sigma-70 factor, ECF subfamily